MLKKIIVLTLILWQLFLLGITAGILTHTPLFVYLLRQAKGQINIIMHTQQVAHLLESSALSEQQKSKIRLIQEVKKFAEEELELTKTSNYNTYYDHGKQPILWILTACEPFAFKEKTWNFPLLGDVSYKGFFDYQPCLLEANELRLQQFDVDVGKVSAWSTLGILSDPILSSMLDDDVGALAELIIHELTHATVYLQSSVDFNENFASFIGRQGAIAFLQYKYGLQNDTLKAYLNNLEKEDKLKDFMLGNKELLDCFYKEMQSGWSFQKKYQMKSQKFDEIILKLHTQDFLGVEKKLKIAQRLKISQNAYLMHFNRYDSQFNQLMELYVSKGRNLRAFIRAAKAHRLGL